ncbi:hypothetical protein HDV00_007999 [Rhizophlyctis rosea]|nr:hypothetical protein HDV00_007999 [Rhizophlyctis rosea]
MPALNKHEGPGSTDALMDEAGQNGGVGNAADKNKGSDSVGNDTTDEHELTTISVGNSRFPITKEQFAKLMDFTRTPPDMVVRALKEWGGVEGVTKALNVDPSHGLNSKEADDVNSERRQLFGTNKMPEIQLPTFLQHVWHAMQDLTLIMLMIAAVVSLIFGIIGDTQAEPGQPKVGWVEGVAILVAVIVIVGVTSVNDWRKDQMLRKQAAETADIKFSVRRDGDSKDVSVNDILAGDIILIKDGDIIPADAIVLESANAKVDESSATGESDDIKKMRFTGVDESDRAVIGHKTAGQQKPANDDHVTFPEQEEPKKKTSATPYLVQSGTKCNGGSIVACAIAVGEQSRYGILLKEVKKENVDTPLQELLADLAKNIGYVGLGAAGFLLAALTIKFIVTGAKNGWSEYQVDGAVNGGKIVLAIVNKIILQVVTIIVVAVPEGLPMAVTIALIYGTRKMAEHNNFVRQLAACETMGGATTICTDKTGTLTENKMTVMVGYFGNRVFEPQNRDYIMGKEGSPAEGVNAEQLPADFISLVRQAIYNNTKAFVGKDDKGEYYVRGDKTETALLNLITDIKKVDLKKEREKIIRVFPFSSKKKSMQTVARLKDGKAVLFVKGAAEIVLASCTSYVEPDLNIVPFSSQKAVTKTGGNIKKEIYTYIDNYAKRCYRNIVIAYKLLTEDQLQQWQHDWEKAEDEDVEPEVPMDDLTFLGLVGIEDPLRVGVDKAVAQCQNAGIVVRMVTGDNLVTATSIAYKAGILQHGGICLEGPEFHRMYEEHVAYHARLAAIANDEDDPVVPAAPNRRDSRLLSPPDVHHKNDADNSTGSLDDAASLRGKPMSAFDKMLPKLRVLARSSPKDKQILVEHLKSLGETVAVTGDGANDGPALKTADVGFAMGIAGSGIAKEAASIILMDDNFVSVVTALVWGRSISDSVRKFLTFQLSVNVSAVIITFVTSVSSGKSESVLTAVQLLWVNLIMDTFAALALATDEPDYDEMLSRPPVNNKKDPLITRNMWGMLLSQGLLQVVVLFILFFAGQDIFNLEGEDAEDINNTICFNAFIWLQVFNEINARRIDREFNVFKRLHKNFTFIGILLFTIVAQIIIVQFGGAAFQTHPINGIQWIVCIAIGFLSLFLGALVRLMWFRVPPRAKPVKVDVFPVINSSEKREMLWRRAISQAARGRTVSGAEGKSGGGGGGENTVTLTLPKEVYEALKASIDAVSQNYQDGKDPSAALAPRPLIQRRDTTPLLASVVRVATRKKKEEEEAREAREKGESVSDHAVGGPSGVSGGAAQERKKTPAIGEEGEGETANGEVEGRS